MLIFNVLSTSPFGLLFGLEAEIDARVHANIGLHAYDVVEVELRPHQARDFLSNHAHMIVAEG